MSSEKFATAYVNFEGFFFLYLNILILGFIRETVPSLTSDMGKKTVSVLAHSFLLPYRSYSVNIFSITPLRYSRH